MSTSKKSLFVAIAIELILLAGLPFGTRLARAAPPQGPWQPSGFLGAWCAQGVPTKQCSITANGPFLTLTNENGSTSSGTYVGMGQNVINADQWNFVQGTLNPDASRINWSNGTYWARCPSTGGGGGGGYRIANVDGTWYRSGNHSQACYIKQRKKSLSLTNENGQTGTGTVDGRWHLSTNWSGTSVNGTISSNGNTIYWDNGTSWTR